MQRSENVASTRRWIGRIAAAVVLISMVFSLSSVRAETTQVNATLCSGNATNASLIVTSPTSDSTVTEMPVTITGVVQDVTQIDISVDGTYNNTVPLSAAQTTFSTDLILTEGTHTLTLVGNDVCQYQNITVNLVVTYQPPVSPGQGSGAPQTPPVTELPSNGDGAVPAPQEPLPLANVPIIGALVPLARDLAKMLDLDATARDGGVVIATVRFTAFTAGMGLIVFGTTLVRLVMLRGAAQAAMQGTALLGQPVQDPKFHSHMRRNVWIARAGGIILTGLSFLV